MDRDIFAIADKLEDKEILADDEFARLILCPDPELSEYLASKARKKKEEYYGKSVFVRGLIEFTSLCRNNCFYCGLRRDNDNALRYRLSNEEIMSCCDSGYALGFRTFVLQGGEDPHFTDERLVPLVGMIREKYPDCAITLSVGERSKDSYQKLFDAGADRYLLRHETADKAHYGSLHPAKMSFDHRIRCLWDLKDIGYQVGCGMMVGSPGQNVSHLIKDLGFIRDLRPEMVGIGPFIPHHDTGFASKKPGSVDLTLRLLSIIRLMLPAVLLPATTALGTLDPMGREKGLMAGANVLMPNLSPVDVRKKYELYDGKICTGEEAAECIRCLRSRVSKTGYEIVQDRGDPALWK